MFRKTAPKKSNEILFFEKIGFLIKPGM